MRSNSDRFTHALHNPASVRSSARVCAIPKLFCGRNAFFLLKPAPQTKMPRRCVHMHAPTMTQPVRLTETLFSKLCALAFRTFRHHGKVSACQKKCSLLSPATWVLRLQLGLWEFFVSRASKAEVRGAGRTHNAEEELPSCVVCQIGSNGETGKGWESEAPQRFGAHVPEHSAAELLMSQHLKITET